MAGDCCLWTSPPTAKWRFRLKMIVVLCHFLTFGALSQRTRCPQDRSYSICADSGEYLITRLEKFTYVTGQGCQLNVNETNQPISCASTIEVDDRSPCRNGRQFVRMKRMIPRNCICVSQFYVEEISCPCQSSQLSKDTCQSQTVSYERRAGDRCEKRFLHTQHGNCSFISSVNSKAADIIIKNESMHPYLTRSRRSVEPVIHQCGEHQIYVPIRNPCPETCEGVLFGRPNRCDGVPHGPGCECKPGYVLDGILCVPPSQCGCLDTVCADRAPSHLCRQWRLEGRCQTDRLGMIKLCRATCQHCQQQQCEDQIATIQCEKLRSQGKCSDEFYRMLCRLTCSPQDCRKLLDRDLFQRKNAFYCNGCPPDQRTGPVCIAGRNQLAFKVVTFHPGVGSCHPRVTMNWLPRPTCPSPEQARLETVGCPPEKRTLSTCENGIQREHIIHYELLEGVCEQHVRKRIKHCACPRPKHFYKCNEVTNEKVTKTVAYRRLEKDGQCERVETTETHATECAEEGIRRITGCRLKRGGDPRPYRNLVLVKSQLDRCICREPSMQVLLEACMCPEAQQPAVRLIQQCPRWCHGLEDNRCDHRCQDIRVWQRFVYAGQDGRCVAEELRRMKTPCCCQRNKQVTKTCDSSGKYEVIHVKETELRQSQCVQVRHEIRRHVQCETGFQHQLLGPVLANGSRGMQTVYNRVDRCQCVAKAVQHQCITKCPDQRKSVECDAGARELVYTLTTFIPVGCKCEQRVYKRRSAVLCPEQTKLISAQCSPVTKIESRMYRRTFLDNCECREETVTKHGPCGKSIV
ncbi:uncharacterized protein DEA37_0010306 [Paragonimus westermani]|uniref:ShKT domain-containing protein n=1 Tax=Paragonimus westermani TaxID=34504 RepID=A0A5J4NSL9_9TREM|nr:uncharacterized protein DEA37_0010306 [Paragonimus westermani]